MACKENRSIVLCMYVLVNIKISWNARMNGFLFMLYRKLSLSPNEKINHKTFTRVVENLFVFGLLFLIRIRDHMDVNLLSR